MSDTTPLVPPVSAVTDADKAEYFYRMKEMLRLWHNEKAQELTLPEFRKWQKEVYSPKEKKCMAELHKVCKKAESDVDTEPYAEEQGGKLATKWDEFIQLEDI